MEEEEEGKVKEEEESNNTLRRYRRSNDVYLVAFIGSITVTFSLEEESLCEAFLFFPVFNKYV